MRMAPLKTAVFIPCEGLVDGRQSVASTHCALPRDVPLTRCAMLFSCRGSGHYLEPDSTAPSRPLGHHWAEAVGRLVSANCGALDLSLIGTGGRPPHRPLKAARSKIV